MAFSEAPAEKLAVRADPKDLYKNRRSPEFRFRVKRFAHIQKLIEAALAEKEFVEIIDIGGSEKYWLIGEEFLVRNRGRLHFTIVNPERQEVNNPDMFTFHTGDGCDPALFSGKVFDIAHSNSVIEHVGKSAATMRFAANMRRLGKRYYMQTPDYWFPYEPHFRFIGFQYLPLEMRVWLMTKMRLGFFKKQDTLDAARPYVEEVDLLSKRDVKRLFPDAEIVHERFMGFSKSLMAIRN